MKARVACGLDRISEADKLLSGRRVGLMTNPTGITHDFISAVDVVRGRHNLTALFACEHGIRGELQAGEHFDSMTDAETGVPVYSTYRGGHRLTDEMIDQFDVFLFDMQDVGVRFYTYLYSLSYAMEECARRGKPVVVLDRLNPTGAHKTGGTVLDSAFSTFVGRYGLPSRTGLTIGEYALYAKDHLKLDVDLTVIPLEGYQRHFYLDDTDTPWVAPSPNCATLHAALCYIGTCVFEGSNLSEGRGTTMPFEWIGAPWVNAPELEKRMNLLHLPGLHFRRVSFTPAFSKHQGVLCHGVQMHVTDREAMDPVLGGLLLMDTVRALHPDQFEFIRWDARYSIDSLLGTDAYRLGVDARTLLAANAVKVRAFAERAKAFRLYD